MIHRALHSAALLASFSVAALLPAAASGQAALQPSDLRYPSLPAFQLPKPQRVVLGNGLVVMLLEDHELPLVEVTALAHGGSRFDPLSKAGTAKLGANLLRSGGTETMTGDQLDDWLESRAAAVEVTVDSDMARASASSLAPDFHDLLRVFADVLRRPAFDAGKLDIARNQAVAAVARQNDEADTILQREIKKAVCGPDSPFAHSETLASLGAIRRDDLLAWHRQAFQPDRMVLGLVGDFRSADALSLVRKAFGDWPRGPGGALPAPTCRTAPSPGVYWADKEGLAQTTAILGHLGLRKDDPDFYAVEILNYVLGGSLTSRLVSHVRAQKGLAYSVSGKVGSDWEHPGLVYFYLSTKTQTTGAGLQAVLDEVRAIQTVQPPTAEEVENARQSLLSSFIFNADVPRKVLTQQLTLALYGYPLDWLSHYRAGLEAVTAAQVREAAVRHLRPDDFAILVAGPAAGRDRPLTDFGPVTKLDLTPPAKTQK